MSNKTIPNFESQIPPHLTAGISASDKWMLDLISVISQKVEWLSNETLAQSKTLDSLVNELNEVKIQVKTTNGRTTANEKDIKSLKETTSNTANFNVAYKIIGKKWFWIGVSVFLFVIYPKMLIMGYPALLDYVKLFFS